MKNFKLFLMMFCATLALGMFTACDDDDVQTGLTGNWIANLNENSGISSVMISFYNNGSGQLRVEYDKSVGQDVSIQSFEYVFTKENGYGYLEIIKSTFEGFYRVTTTKSVLRLYEDEYYYEFTRVK